MSLSARRFDFDDDPFFFTKRSKRRNNHHLVPRSRGGNNHTQNLLFINEEKHALWHKLWGNRTIDEVLDLLTRMKSMKKHQKSTKRRKAA